MVRGMGVFVESLPRGEPRPSLHLQLLVSIWEPAVWTHVFSFPSEHRRSRTTSRHSQGVATHCWCLSALYSRWFLRCCEKTCWLPLSLWTFVRSSSFAFLMNSCPRSIRVNLIPCRGCRSNPPLLSLPQRTISGPGWGSGAMNSHSVDPNFGS